MGLSEEQALTAFDSRTHSGLADAEAVVDKASSAHANILHLVALRRREVHSLADFVQDSCRGMGSHTDCW